MELYKKCNIIYLLIILSSYSIAKSNSILINPRYNSKNKQKQETNHHIIQKKPNIVKNKTKFSEQILNLNIKNIFTKIFTNSSTIKIFLGV